MPATDIRLANITDSTTVAGLVGQLLTELEPQCSDEIDAMDLDAISEELLRSGKIQVLLASISERQVGLLTLHQCAAIYAGGIFGEISEFYVVPELRGTGLGKRLLNAAIDLARQQQWLRLEVGAPAGERWQRSQRFYRDCGFKETGPRLRLLV